LILPLAIAIPAALLWYGQPSSPTLTANSRELMSSYLAESGRTPIAQADSSTPAPSASPSPTAELASTPTGQDGYGYQLSLAQGFLTKAITYSQTSAATQTEGDRQQILGFLQQALESANRAIELAPTQGLGFLVRARVYKTAAVVKPELEKMAQQDLTIARALGIDANNPLVNSPDALQYLPTEQAQDLANAPVIASPEEGNTASTSGIASANTQEGTVVIRMGERTASVDFPGLTSNMTLRADPVDPMQNRQNAIFSIATRTEGQGFTIQSNVPLDQDVTLQWRAIVE
jgi:hypothetical protein